MDSQNSFGARMTQNGLSTARPFSQTLVLRARVSNGNIFFYAVRCSSVGNARIDLPDFR
jgi:hypothetical protein